jgi:hypothetical protein
VSAVKACEVSAGVFNRNPGREDFEAHDDYVGIAAASAFMGDEFTRDILEHALKPIGITTTQEKSQDLEATILGF